MIYQDSKTLMELLGLVCDREWHRNSQRRRSYGGERRSARDHGAERLVQEYVRQGASVVLQF